MKTVDPYPIKFAPILKERIWGGHQLKSLFGVPTIESAIGEYWVLSGHPNGTSVVVNGDLFGKTLTEIIELYPQAYLGCSPQQRFPLLVKFLEATTDLSVQIHPDDAFAQSREDDFGKTEAWYVLDCVEDARVNYGHRFNNQTEFYNAVAEGRVKDYLRYEPIEKDQFVYIPARTLHALLGGTMVIEVQQTSDVTYRVYDWDRVDDSGRPRDLHIERAAEVMSYGECQSDYMITPTTLQKTNVFIQEQWLSCPYFTIEKLELNLEPAQVKRATVNNPDILIVVDGSTQLQWEEGTIPLQRGDTVLVPATLPSYCLIPQTQVTLLRTFY